jgi:hypothetical protein
MAQLRIKDLRNDNSFDVDPLPAPEPPPTASQRGGPTTTSRRRGAAAATTAAGEAPKAKKSRVEHLLLTTVEETALIHAINEAPLNARWTDVHKTDAWQAHALKPGVRLVVAEDLSYHFNTQILTKMKGAGGFESIFESLCKLRGWKDGTGPPLTDARAAIKKRQKS